MTRPLRNYCESGVYHVMFRGANKQDIFIDKRDHEKMLELLTKIKEKKGFKLYAYCLMNNHVHLVIKEQELRDISDIMKRLIAEYTQWFNFKYERTGSLTESRYKSCAVENDDYLMHLIRYIHQNPVKAGLASVDEYQWSSYSAYLNEQNLVDTTFLFEVLPKHSFESFHQEIETDAFELYYNEKYSDEDLVRALKNMGIDNPKMLQRFSRDELEVVILKLRENGKFSTRCIARVTGIHRRKL